ncbi:MAG: DUF4254 domain-containing protein [Tannerella sp.]|jgi:hypothetical protein|nr:DUF4254 domain-containing protein [Tannerella sp.]
MNQFSKRCVCVFEQATNDYHIQDDADTPVNNPFEAQSIAYYLYLKNWIDAVQWHLEDIIRDPEIMPEEAIVIKRRIDKSNQDRTDLVEWIDRYFLEKYKYVQINTEATINTESPAWAIDRLSILILKIYHMEQEVNRGDADAKHQKLCEEKLRILYEQQNDLTTALDQLLDDIEKGKKYMKLYKQMKMYNDPSLNPVLYKCKK